MMSTALVPVMGENSETKYRLTLINKQYAVFMIIIHACDFIAVDEEERYIVKLWQNYNIWQIKLPLIHVIYTKPLHVIQGILRKGIITDFDIRFIS